MKILAGTMAVLAAAGALYSMDGKERAAPASFSMPETLSGEQQARAQEVSIITDKLKACQALGDEKAYGKKWEDYAYMVPGKDGWVFRSKQDFRQAFKLGDEDARLYRALSDALQARGTTLVLAVIPTRGIAAAEKLSGDNPAAEYDPAAARASYNNMLRKLNTHGVLAAGTPDPASGAHYFNIADQHWTTRGAREMAEAVAALVKRTPFWDKIPHEDYKTVAGKIVTYDGRFGEAVEALCGFRPAQEVDTEMTTVPVKESGDENALFGDAGAPEVVLVGTSNSRRDEFDANFSGFLKEALSADVYNAAISGGGMDDSLVAYLDSDNFRKNPPALLVWEIPGYYNLGGEGMEAALRQSIASVYGYCDNPITRFGPQMIGKERVYLIENLGDRKIAPGSVYIAIDFDKPVKKDFSVSFKTSDKENRYFKFKKRRESNGDTFFYLPAGGEGTFLTDIALNSAEGIEGLSVRARLCPMPKAGE